MPASIAAVNQFANCLIGSGLRSLRRRPFPACSYREAEGSCEITTNKNSPSRYCAVRKLSSGKQLREPYDARAAHDSSRLTRKSCRPPNSDHCGGGVRRRGLTQLLDHLRNDFNGAIDFSFSVETAERKT